jgi:hypothetical protein
MSRKKAGQIPSNLMLGVMTTTALVILGLHPGVSLSIGVVVGVVAALLRKQFANHASPTVFRRPSIPPSVRNRVFIRDNGQCQHCGATENLEIDHIIPVSRGGSSTENNLQVLCAPCNRSKGNRHVG